MMIWNLSTYKGYNNEEILASGPVIKTPSGQIRVIDIDTVAGVIKGLIVAAEHAEYIEGDSTTVKDARKFLDYLYESA